MEPHSKSLTSNQNAVLRNVQARYPGFTNDVASAFWRLVDREKLDAKGFEIGILLLAKWPDGLNIADLSDHGETSIVSVDAAMVRKWLDSVLIYHNYVESILDGSVLLPFDAGSLNIANQLQNTHNENKRLIGEILLLKDKLALSNMSINDLDHHRVRSIYKIIFGISFVRFKYRPHSRNGAAGSISKILAGVEADVDCELDEDTVLKVLKAAYNYLSGPALEDI